MPCFDRIPLLFVAVVSLAACAQPALSPTAVVQVPTIVTLAATALPSPTLSPTIPPTPAPTLAASPLPSATSERLPTYDLVLLNATLIDGTGASPVMDAALAIRAGRIAAIGHSTDIRFAPDTPVRDLHGATLMPGFINAHVHTHQLSDEQLKQWARAGITTVRDLSGPLDRLVARRNALADNPEMPRLLVAGPMVTVPEGHPIPIYGQNERVLAVSGPDDARATINGLLDAGVNLIKIAVSGRTDTNWPELSNDEISAITEAAHARGARVTAHVDRASALRRAVEHGIDDAAHSPRDRIPDDLVALMVERGVALIPTIDVYEGLAEERGIGEQWRRTTLPVMQDNLRRFVAAGGILALGDDYGNPRVALGMPMPEIEHWLAAGLSPMQVIVAATQNGAIVCGLEGEIGTLKTGMRADLLVVEGDPLTDSTAFSKPLLVVRDGTIVFERV